MRSAAPHVATDEPIGGQVSGDDVGRYARWPNFQTGTATPDPAHAGLHTLRVGLFDPGPRDTYLTTGTPSDPSGRSGARRRTHVPTPRRIPVEPASGGRPPIHHRYPLTTGYVAATTVLITAIHIIGH